MSKYFNNVKEFENYVVSSVDDSFTTLEKIRYVYILCGKYLAKYTEFFLSLNGKLGEESLSPRKLDRIYENKNIKNRKNWNKVICRNSAQILQNIYSRLGINSFIVNTCDSDKVKGMKNNIYHFFLCVSDGKDNYFLTLTPDLAYIQNNMMTQHFASDIRYMVINDEGELVKYYDSEEEIKHKNLREEDIKKIDEKIGYLIPYINSKGNETGIYADEFLTEYQKQYINILCEETEFYNEIFPLDSEKQVIKNLSNPNIEEWNEFINKVCKYAGKRICELINEEYTYTDDVEMMSFYSWCAYIKDLLRDKKYNSREIIYQNPELLYNKVVSLHKAIDKYIINEYDSDVIEEKIRNFRGQIEKRIHDISKHFVNPKYLIEPKDMNSYISNEYLNKKFTTLFPLLYCTEDKRPKNFNNLNYSEQIEVLKYTIESIFQEVKSQNLISPNKKIVPIFERINIYSIKEKDKDNYCVCFEITDKKIESSSSYWYFYDMRKNIFKPTKPTNMLMHEDEYIILSQRLKDMIGKIEEMGEVHQKK